MRGTGSAGFTTISYYDALQRPIGLYNDLPAAGADVNFGLAYNPASQIRERSRDNDSYAWRGAYDVSRPYQVNGLNQYVSAGPASFAYDANGNLTSDGTTSGGTTSYTYDVENRLVAASNGASLVYDPLGRLFQTSGGAAGTTEFLYDGDRLIAEYDGWGTLLRRYVHGPGADEPVAVYDGAALGLAGRRYTLPDERGSVIGLVHSSGAPSAINSYDSWGIPGAANAGRFQYTGQAWIPELRMYHYKARIYSPTLGRFLQTDPIGYDDQMNLYGYANNDPINKTDPTGKKSCPKKVAECPDVPLPNREIRLRLAKEVGRPTSNVEVGGQAIQNIQTKEITYRTGAKAGTGIEGEFAHNPAPEGHRTIMRSHTHYHNNNERGLQGSSNRQGQNGPSRLDQENLHKGNRAVQTIGPSVTTTLFRSGRQDYLVVDSGNRAALPDLKSQGIVVLDEEPR